METDSVDASSFSVNLYTSDHPKVLSMNQSQNTCDDLKNASLDDIDICLSESLHIGDEPKMFPDTILSPPLSNSDKLNVIDDAIFEDLVEEELFKSATLTCSSNLPLSRDFTDGKCGEGVSDTAEEMELASCESNKNVRTPSISLPTSFKLVSALKGTREKLGAPRDKLSVTWAPDVYDPPPSAPSTAVINPKQRRKSDRKKSIDNKKNGKSKQKKRSSKGSSSSSSSKDKKYYKDSNIFYKSFESKSKMLVDGFDCGSTFLKGSVTNLHYSLAEAT